MKLTFATAAALAMLLATPTFAAERNGFTLEVSSGNQTLPEIRGRGSVYIEALKDRPYELRVTNPLGVRVAVALAVDGRNTIDARRTTAWDASKWVIEPYGSIVISGWQVSGNTARLFTFTTERRSYAAWLGDTSNLGVIEAVVFRERRPEPRRCGECDVREMPQQRKDSNEAAPAAPRAQSKASDVGASVGGYAATGMGDATENVVTRVAIALEREPVAQLRIRYEFHDQLVALGLLPRGEDRMSRRERATGFGAYCPEPR